MNSWISKVTNYLNKFLEVGVLLLGVSVIAEILFGGDAWDYPFDPKGKD